jgi:hypothetical protein
MWTFGCRAHDHEHYRDDDEYHITPRDIAFGFLTFMIILSNLQVRMHLVKAISSKLCDMNASDHAVIIHTHTLKQANARTHNIVLIYPLLWFTACSCVR